MQLNSKAINSIKVLSSISGVVLLMCSILHTYHISCYIALITFTAFVVNTVIFEKNRLLFKYIHLFLPTFLFLLGVYVCDNNKLWLGEIDANTFYYGAFNFLALYYWIFYSFLRTIDHYFEIKTKHMHIELCINSISITKFIYKHGSKIVFVFSSLLFLSVVRHPFFMVGVENRFEYAAKYISRLINILRVFPALFGVLIIGPILNQDKGVTKKQVIIKIVLPYIPYLLFLIWTGNKFGAFWELVYMLIIPFFATIKIKWSSVKKIIKNSLYVIALLVLLLFSYYLLSGNSFKAALDLIKIRIACQGELWWKLLAIVDNGGIKIGVFNQEISNLIDSLITEGDSKNYGIYHLMSILGNPAVVNYYSGIKTRFTAAGIELPFYCFQYLAFILVPLFYGTLMSWITNTYINSVKEKRFVASISSARLLQISVSAIQQGDWYIFFSVVSVIFLFLLIISNLIAIKNK